MHAYRYFVMPITLDKSTPIAYDCDVHYIRIAPQRKADGEDLDRSGEV
jgi:hypothetical protein